MRTDDDTWDITSSVGSTALLVAAARALEAGKSNPVAGDPFAEVFCRAAGGDWTALLDGRLRGHRLMSDWGRAFIDFQAARTRYFDDYFRRAARAGARQIVILAAGLDSRAYRLGWPSGTRVFELDQPRVLDFKRSVLTDYGATPRAERIEIPIDLREDWPKVLHDNGFDPTAASAWIAEGLLVYLPAASQQQLFAGVDALSAPRSHVAVEDSRPMDTGVFEAHRDRELAAGEDVNFFSLAYNQRHEPAEDWFTERGWRADATPLNALLAELGRPVPDNGSDAGQMTGSITLVSAVKAA